MRLGTPHVLPVILLCATAFVAATGAADGTDAVRKVDPATMTLRAHPAFDGVSNGPVHGDGAEAGLYAGTGLMKKGAVFAPHAHPDDRLSVVVSGTMYLGEGDEVDAADTVAYPAGTLAVTPAGTVHYMMAIDGDVRILEIGSGPSGTSFPAGG